MGRSVVFNFTTPSIPSPIIPKSPQNEPSKKPTLIKVKVFSRIIAIKSYSAIVYEKLLIYNCGKICSGQTR